MAIPHRKLNISSLSNDQEQKITNIRAQRLREGSPVYQWALAHRVHQLHSGGQDLIRVEIRIEEPGHWSLHVILQQLQDDRKLETVQYHSG